MESKKKQLVAVIPHTCEGVDVSDTTAGQADVRSGKYFYSALGDRVEGQIADYSGAVSVTPTEQAQTVSTGGKYVGSDITVGAIPSEYKDTTGTDATAGDILAGKKAVTGAGLVTGSVQTYAGASTVTQNGTLPTAGKYVESDIEVAVPSSTPTLITKQITANGTYNAASDNADGFSEVTVSVVAVGKLPQVVDRSVTSIDAADLAGVTLIGNSAFRGCDRLSSIIVPSNVTLIRNSAFENCTNLTSVTLSEGLTYIYADAFSNCLILPSITLPSSITNISQRVFNYCDAMRSVTILATTPPKLSGTNAIPSNVTTIYIPNGTLSAYQTATNWSSFSSKFVELPA